MSKRRSFRPALDDVLEQRLVLSRAGILAARLHAAVGVRSAPVAKGLGTVATLGDSYTDEYSTYPGGRSISRNWVQMLAATRGVNFGTYSNVSRGESRYQGFGLNFARSNAMTDDVINYQLPVLTRKVSHGGVKNVVILAGGNDFLVPLQSIAQGRATPQEVGAELPQIAARAAANVQTAVSTLLATDPNLHIVVSTIDVVGLPVVQESLRQNPQLAPLIQGVGQAVDSFNAAVSNIAAAYAPSVALMDVAGRFQGFRDSIAVGQTQVPFGGAVVTLNKVGDDFHYLFQSDGIHPGAVGQGVLANLVVETLNTNFGSRVSSLTPNEIVKYATATQYPTQIHGWKGPKPPIPRTPPGQHFRVI